MSDLNSVCAERDQLVACLARHYPSVIAPVDDAEPGWQYAVYIETPEGQLSWHVPDHEVETFFADIPFQDLCPWDGHSTEEKYQRLSRIRPPVLMYEWFAQ